MSYKLIINDHSISYRMAIPPFLQKGKKYSTTELVEHFGGNKQHGIIYSRSQNVILAISGGVKYKDRPDENNPGIFLYHGSGEKGDQDPNDARVGNRQLKDSVKNHTTVFLFEKPKKGDKCKFIDEVQLIKEPYYDPDDAPGNRKLIYPLRYLSVMSMDDLVEAIKDVSDDELIRIVHTKPKKKSVTTTQYDRDPYVVLYALRRSKGMCDLCEKDAPFQRKDGTPYLEVHHIVPLSEGGEDSWNNACSLCPNCHRKMHIVKDADDIQKLKKVASIQL